MDSDFERVGTTKRIKVEEEEEEDQGTNRMETLPGDIILNILSGLPISSLVQFRCVCKSWRLLAKDPEVVNMHSSRMFEKNPCLIFHCDYAIRNQLYFVEFPDSNDKIEKVKKFQVPFWSAMPEFDVVGTCNGLLCLSDSLFNDALYLYNPFTRNYQELPKSMQYANQEVVFGFGFHPITKEYKVVKIVYFKNTAGRGNRRPFRINHQYSEVQIFTVGRSVWRSLGKADYHLVQWPTQVLVNGRLHWVTWPTRTNRIRSMVSFDLADEQFQEVPRPADGYSLSRSNYHLLVIGGCLSAAVYCHYGKLEIWVMEEYGVMESWVLKYHIGNYVPKGFQKEMDISFKISRFAPRGRFVRVIGVLNNGEILLEYKSRALVSYNPKTKKSRDLIFPGIPKWFRAIVHHGSLNWIDAFTNG
jgi:F-box interacting protein|uniref:F-box domain-containing protein n=1 Tax=Fagus sylvatica TaxID=28930 RepID=A0A2N9EZZ9_FAGSY